MSDIEEGDLLDISAGEDAPGSKFLDSAGRVVNERREWRCRYCQRLNEAQSLSCQGCGASA